MKRETEESNSATWHQLLPAARDPSAVHLEIQPSAGASAGEDGGSRTGPPKSRAIWRLFRLLRSRRQVNNVEPGSSHNDDTCSSPRSYKRNYAASTTNSQKSSRNRQRSWNSRRVRKRAVFKNGECNVVQTNVPKRRRRYLADFFTTMVDIQWRWTLLIFTLSFILSWLAFAVLWWLIALTHGDLEPEHLPGKQEASDWTPCVVNIYGFASCFLFSIETQHTIGYGARYTTEECPEAVFIMCIQSIIGVMIQALMVGVVFSKLTRPKMRAQTLLFSRNAVICQRDGLLCLMFRVGDMRKSHIIATHIRAQLIKSKLTMEREELPYYQYELKVGVDHDESDIFFIWPMTIVHKITPDSPLYSLSASDLLKEKFEIVVILEGTIESTSMTTQARSSYLPSEILWGHRFEPLVSFRKDTGQYVVDYSLFDNTYEIETPLCSSQQLDEFRKLEEDNNQLGPPRLLSFSGGNRPNVNATPMMRAVSPLYLPLGTRQTPEEESRR